MQLNFASIPASISEVLSPPLSPPSHLNRGPQRNLAKASALKLITSFDKSSAKTKFFDDGQTPLAAGVTPIAESAISPAGPENTTAFLRPSTNSRFNTPMTARPSERLPSIGEIPADLNRENLRAQAKQAAMAAMPNRTGSADVVRRDVRRPPSPDDVVMFKMQENRTRNGSRDRMPHNLTLDLRREPANEITSPESSSSRFHWPRRRGAGSISGSINSASSSHYARAGHRSTRSANNSAVTSAVNSAVGPLDDFVSSIDSTGIKKARSRQESRGRHGDGTRNRNASRSRERSGDRGRQSERSWTKPKRSPTSPIPMSPQDLANYARSSKQQQDNLELARKAHNNSRSSHHSRARSPNNKPALTLESRGRSRDREINESSRRRSPSSPQPMTRVDGSSDEEDLRRALEAKETFRLKRNASRSGRDRPKTPQSATAAPVHRSRSRGAEPDTPLTVERRAMSTEHYGDLRTIKDSRQRKRDEAARELEERRKSLASRGRDTGNPEPQRVLGATDGVIHPLQRGPEHVCSQRTGRRTPGDPKGHASCA